MFNEMEDLKFNIDSRSGTFFAEFQANSNFALHMEKIEGSLVVYQRSVERGEYDVVRDLDVNVKDRCVDVDFVGAVYPKWIKVESNVRPYIAKVVFAES